MPNIVLSLLFEKNFEGLEFPDVNKIKEHGELRSFPYTTFDDVWDAAIIVLMQQGIIIREKKDLGIIIITATPILTIYVEKGEVVKIYASVCGINKKSDRPEEFLFTLNPSKAFNIEDELLHKLSTQVYAGEKWKYLYERK
jgi:hypothetical protein